MTFGDRLFLAYSEKAKELGRKLNATEIKEVANVIFALETAQPAPLVAKEKKAPRPAPIPRKRNELLDALVAVCGGDPEHTTNMAFRCAAKALSEIKTVCPDLTPEMLQERANRYKRLHPEWPLTTTALAKWWANLGGGPRTKSAESDIYCEPHGWRNTLQAMYDLSPEGIRDKQWLDLDPTIRRDVLQKMRGAA